MNIKKITWNDRAATALFAVMGPDAVELQSEVERGISELHCIDDRSYLITRVEGDRLIVACFVGENLNAVARCIHKAAKRVGCKTIQVHTERPGLQRLLSEFGAVCVGRYYIYVAKVN